MPTPSSSTSSRSSQSTSKRFFSQSNRTVAPQANDAKAGGNSSAHSNARSLHSRNEGREEPDTPSTSNRQPPVTTKEAAVQTCSPPPPSPSRSGWGSLRSSLVLSPTKNATPASAAPKRLPAVEPEPTEDQQPSSAWHSQHSQAPKDSLPSFSRGFPPGPSRLRRRSSSVDSWRSPSNQTKILDSTNIARRAPPPLNLTTDNHALVVGHSTSFRTKDQGPSSSSSSSVLSPAQMSSPAVRSTLPQTSGRGYLSWRGTSSSHPSSMVPAFALAVAPPPAPRSAQLPWVSPTFSPPQVSPSSMNDSRSVKSFETTSSTASTLRSKRRGKRSKHHKDGKGSETSTSSSSATTSSSGS